MNIEKWFLNGTGLKIKYLRYLKMPPFPYLLYTDDKNIQQAGLYNLVEHNLIIEFYSEKIDEINEEKIEMFLKSEDMNYKKIRDWLQEEEIFVTTYEIEPFLEKVLKR